MQQPRRNSRKPKEIFKVDWLGKDNKNIYSKVFADDVDAAMDFAKQYKYSIVSRKAKESKDTNQWEIIPTLQARELVKNVKLRKALDQKNGFYNADGVSEIEVVTTSQAKASQTIRLVSMLAFTPVLVYAGTRKELPTWLRYSLFAVAGINFLSNLKNFSTNSKIEKTLKQQETEE